MDDDDDRCCVRVLGPIAVTGPDGPLHPGGPKPRLVLALLVADPGRTVTVDRLIDGLWGDDPPATARKTLQVHVSNLRRNLGPTFPLETSRSGYRVDAAEVSIDAVAFERELRSGESAIELDPAAAATTLTRALERWQGPPYADLGGEQAIQSHVARLAELRVRAVELRIDADLRLGRHERVLGELESLTADHPYRERLRALQMLALYRSGRQTEALRAYERTRLVLADELGIDPGPELRELHQRVLEQSPELDLTVSIGASAEAAPTLAADLTPGTSVRGYELRELLGERDGAMVFRAYQASVGREVALKVIKPEISNEPGFVKRFDAGCRRLVDLEHPHIVGLFDHWRDPTGAYVSMPLLRGGTLAGALAAGPMATPVGLATIDQLCAALSHAHRRGVVHADIRPSNVLLDEDGNAYLSDFHIEGDRSIGDGRGPADALHLAPEQLATGPVGPACDVFAMGVLSCRILAGVEPADVDFAPAGMPSTLGNVIRRATEPDPGRRYERIDAFVRDLRRCFGVDVVSTRSMVTTSAVRNPYKGLRAFRESDASDFFGRTDLADELIDRVRAHHLTSVVGPSGSGKSSLVHAGLVPAVRAGSLSAERDVVIAEMFPGAYPFEELSRALLEVAVRRPTELVSELLSDERGLLRVAKNILPDDDTDLLLIIDQFEELFAVTADESIRKRFLDTLTAAAREASCVRIVVTLRADFFGRPLNHPEFGGLMKASLTTVSLPGDDDLAAAIIEPARRAGLEVEPGLVPTILRDVADEPGSLPMLQYALTELADQCADGVLTVNAYRRTGGVVGSLATRAEEIYAGLPSAGRDAARALFVRLVSLSDDAEDTRRRVRRSELDALGLNAAALDSAIDAFGTFRLLAFDHDPVTRGPTVEVAHEALIREWPRFRAWVDEQRDDLRMERRLATAVTEWRQSENQADLLISGVRLERFEQWATSTTVRLTGDEQLFLELSRREEDHRDRSAATRRRRVLISMSVLLVAALFAAAIALVQRERAGDQAVAARAAAETADALRVEAETKVLVERSRNVAVTAASATDPDTRVLLAATAADALDELGLTDPAVDSALYQSLFEHHIAARSFLPDDPDSNWFPIAFRERYYVAPSPDGTMFVAGSVGGTAAVVADASTGEEIGRLEFERERILGTNWDGLTGGLMTGLSTGDIHFWRPDGDPIGTSPVAARAVWPQRRDERFLTFLELFSFNDDGNDLVVVDHTTGDEVFRIRGPITDVSWSRTDDRLMIRFRDGRVVLYETGVWEDVTPPEWRSVSSPLVVDNIVIGADGRHAWARIGSDLLRVDTATGATTHRFETRIPDASFIRPTHDGELVVVGTRGAPTLTVFDAASGQPARELSLARATAPSEWHDFAVGLLTGRRLVLAQINPLIWDLDRPGGATSMAFNSARATTVAFASDGGVVIGSDGGRIDVVESTGEPRYHLDVPIGDSAPVVSADGATMVVPGVASVTVVDTRTGAVTTTGPEGFPRPLGVSPDGSAMIVGTALEPSARKGAVAAVAVADARSGELVRRLESLVDAASTAVSSDGAIAAVPVTNVQRSGLDVSYSYVLLADMRTGEVIRRGPPQECITAADFSSDDRMIATVGCDGDVSLFDVELLASRESPSSRVAGTTAIPTPGVGVVFGPDDDEVIVTRTDGTISSYEVDGFALRWQFDVGDHVVSPIVRGRDLWFATTSGPADLASTRGVVVSMPLDHDDLVALAHGTATRDLTDAECEAYLGQPDCSTG